MRSYSETRQAISTPALYDKWFVFAVLGIIIMGLLMMTSASIVISDKQIHQPFYYLYKQLIYLTLGFIMSSVVIQIETTQWEKHGGYLLLSVLLMWLGIFIMRII